MSGPRTPPHDPDLERSVLGAALWDMESAALVGPLAEHLFVAEWHRDVLKGIRAALTRGVAVDGPSVRAALIDAGRWDESTTAAKLALLMEAGTVTTSLPYYLTRLRDLALRRALIQESRETLEAAYDLEVSGAATLERHMGTCIRIELEGQPESILSPEQFAEEVAVGKEPPRLETGWPRLDAVLQGGLTCGDLHLLAGRPGMGKTAFALQMLHYVTTFLGLPGLLVSLDMSRGQIGRRYLAHAGLDDLRKSGLHITDPIAPTASGVVAIIRRAVVQVGIQVAVVDHVGKITPDRECDRHEQEVGETAITLRNAARALDLPLIVLSQMNRAVEGRAGQRPMLSDLRDSGQLEQEAATVMFLWPKKAKREDLQDVIVSVEKDRHGPTGDVDMTFKRAEGRLLA